MAYKVEFRPDASRSIGKLDSVISRRIIQKITWLTENIENITPEPLTGDLKGLFKLKVGHFRVVYSIKGQTIHIHLIGHRSDIYK